MKKRQEIWVDPTNNQLLKGSGYGRALGSSPDISLKYVCILHTGKRIPGRTLRHSILRRIQRKKNLDASWLPAHLLSNRSNTYLIQDQLSFRHGEGIRSASCRGGKYDRLAQKCDLSTLL